MGEEASLLLAQILRRPRAPIKEPLKWHVSEGAEVDLDDPEVLKEWAYGLNDDVGCD